MVLTSTRLAITISTRSQVVNDTTAARGKSNVGSAVSWFTTLVAAYLRLSNTSRRVPRN